MKSITTRILSIILATTIIGMGLIAVIGNVLAGNTIKEQSLSRVGESTAHSATEIDMWFARSLSYIDAIAAGFSGLQDIEPETLLPELVYHTDSNDDFFSVYVGYPDGIGVFNDEWEPNYNEWRANERDWYIGAVAAQGAAYISEMYVDAESGDFCITFSKIFTHNGNFAGVAAIDVFLDVLNDNVNNLSVGEGSYAFMTDSDGNILAHRDRKYLPVVDSNEETVLQNIAKIENGSYKRLIGDDVLKGETITLRGADGETYYFSARSIPSTGWLLYTAIPTSVVNAPIRQQITAAVIIFVVVLVAASLLIYYTLMKIIVRPVKSVTKAARTLARGESGVRLDDNYIGEIAMLADSFRGMEAFNIEQTEWLVRIADGDLTVKVHTRSEDDRIGQAIERLLAQMNRMFSEISGSTHRTADSAKQIADGSQLLAQGTSAQAAAIKELSETLSEITSKTKQNADIAKEASRLSNSILERAEKGSVQMDQMMTAVTEINTASQSISKVIKVIDDIAFQTNILALNAAVEAARAGQHGKGFAVVAEEVRNLASKSAAAAKDTEGLIENSIEKANLGLSIATETAASLKEIVDGIGNSFQSIGQIAKYSDEEAVSASQVNNGIDQISQVIQQNSATAEQSAAASIEMKEQSEILEQLISQYKLDSFNALPY